VKQFEIWWAQLPEPAGQRPVLLLSHDAAYEYLTRVLVVEITTQWRGIPVEVDLSSTEGLPQLSVANFDNLFQLDKRKVLRRMGSVAPDRIWELKRALGHALDWPELKEAAP
jgi:mRNA-degrading endonuclease toxin of MazEF toxin-antitoxin module